MSIKNEFRILSPTAILGYGYPESSFRRGISRKPHCIAVDAGSTDPGPYYLGSGTPFTNRAAVKRDLRLMLVHGNKLKIPVVIGTAGGSGARPHVDWCEKIIREIAGEEKLSFRLGIVYSDIDKKIVLQACTQKKLIPLQGVPHASAEIINQTTYIAGQIGMEPIINLYKKGCTVILAGRCYDPAVFAALPVHKGFDPGLSLHCGKILECAAIAATPGSGSDCALGIIKKDSFILETLSPQRKFTRKSAAAHTLYEKSDPSHLPGPGGMIDLTGTVFTELSGGRVSVHGSRFIPSPQYFVKIEGARQTGYRTISIAGIRDPIMISQIDTITSLVKKKVTDNFVREKIKGEINFIVYGKNGVMSDRDPVKQTASHELGVVIDAVGDTQDSSASLCALARSTLLHWGYPNRISTAGNLAFPFSPSDAKMGPVFEFSLYHLMPVDDPAAFPYKIVNIGKAPVYKNVH